MFGLSGYAGSGKDTVGQILVKDHGFEPVSFAGPLKEVAERVNPLIEVPYYMHDDGYTTLSHLLALEKGWDRVKDEYPTSREFLQNLGLAIREVIGEDTWVNAAFNKIDTYDDDSRYVFTDMRFPNEMGAVRWVGGACVRINRPGYGPVNGHISEIALDDARFDYTIENDGTLHKLEHAIAAMVAEEEHTEREPFV
jgi:hypothetical protein